MLSSDDNFQELVISFYHTFLVSAFTHTEPSHHLIHWPEGASTVTTGIGWGLHKAHSTLPRTVTQLLAGQERTKRSRRHRRQQRALPGGQSGIPRSTAAQQDAVIEDFTLLWPCIPTRLLSLKLIVISTTWYKYKIKADKMAQKVKVFVEQAGDMS